MSVLGAIIFVVTLVGVDQIIKYFVIEYLKPIGVFEFIEGFIRFRYVENTGAVFGSFSTHTAVLTVVSIILLIVTIYFLISQKNKSKLVSFTLLLMISGGIGNIIDRIRLHYVVDYIEPTFINFAVFNFADCLITVGAFVLMIYLVVDIIKDEKNIKARSKTKASEFLSDETVVEDERN
ncbi:MAG: signal peptidase II [Clostridia bacterium]|nr:signal peptidase II [Clostridia bacterium]